MATINIIVGSIMGTALGVAQTAQTLLADKGHKAILHESFNADDPAIFDPSTVLLVCTSSTGMGDLPQNIIPFYLHLTTKFPAIAGMKYGVISLGDSSYPNFAQAGTTMDEALADIGAVRLGEVLVLDATQIDDHDEAAAEKLSDWIHLLPAPEHD